MVIDKNSVLYFPLKIHAFFLLILNGLKIYEISVLYLLPKIHIFFLLNLLGRKAITKYPNKKLPKHIYHECLCLGR